MRSARGYLIRQPLSLCMGAFAPMHGGNRDRR